MVLVPTTSIYREFLSKSMKALQDHPEIGLCCADFSYFKDDFNSIDPKNFFRLQLRSKNSALKKFSHF